VRRFRKTRPHNWRIGYTRELVADPRNFIERRFDDLTLALLINRSRPQMCGPTTLQAMAELVEVTRDEVLPWEVSDEWIRDMCHGIV
jgi:hypothetical protein